MLPRLGLPLDSFPSFLTPLPGPRQSRLAVHDRAELPPWRACWYATWSSSPLPGSRARERRGWRVSPWQRAVVLEERAGWAVFAEGREPHRDCGSFRGCPKACVAVGVGVAPAGVAGVDLDRGVPELFGVGHR